MNPVSSPQSPECDHRSTEKGDLKSETIPWKDHRLARDAQHQGSERAFWERLGLNPYLVARDLYAQRNDFVAMHFVVVKVIAERAVISATREN